MPEKIEITISKAPSEEPLPFTLGIPFPAGELQPEVTVSLTESNTGMSVPVQTMPLAHWPDGSVRWLKTRFLAQPDANNAKHYDLSTAGDDLKSDATSSLTVTETQNDILVDNG